MTSKASYLVSYLHSYTLSIGSHYTWDPKASRAAEVLGSELQGTTRFEQTLDLRRRIHVATRESKDAGRVLELAKFIVQEWAGIWVLKDEGLSELVERLDPISRHQHPLGISFPIANISSASTWLSALRPDWAAIYDTRVAWALNAISVITRAGARVFPIPQGRYGALDLLDAGTLALHARLRATATDERPRESDRIYEQHYAPRLQCYVEYLDVLQHAHWELWPAQTPLAYTEMLLSGMADTVIFRDLVAGL